ncbi:MAG: GTPase Era [Christensenellales bacterium]
MEHKTAFIAIAGRPNAGKSTLINALVGAKIAIVSNKPQTTRNRIAGIVTGADYQMVFLDTPGLHDPKNKLDEIMLKTAYDAVRDVEAVIFICDAFRGVTGADINILDRLKKGGAPIIAAVNKADAAGKQKSMEEAKKLSDAGVDCVFILSAKTGEGIDELKAYLTRFLTLGPRFYTDGMYTDQSERGIISEIIREKALEMLRDEVPHGVCVTVESLSKREDKQITDISAVIICERESHKGIIIGKGGRMLKRIGSESRQKIEELLCGKVYLELWVKVEEGWRDSIRMMRELGYE